jgi:uncharacterized cupredoxin-like copper-binding protein
LALGLLPALAGVLAVTGAIGCGGGSHMTAATGRMIAVSERDFHIAAPLQVQAGTVVIRAHNNGPDRHELIVVRDGQRLPMRADGFTVDEETLAHQEAGALEPGEPGSVRDLVLHLRPGRYVLFCNMSGHYLGGTHHALVVT